MTELNRQIEVTRNIVKQNLLIALIDTVMSHYFNEMNCITTGLTE